MPRAATGSVRWRRGRAYARVTLGPGDRPEFLLATCAAGDEDKARERARILAELAKKLRDAGHAEVAPRLLERAAQRDGQALQHVIEAAERLCAGAAVAPRSARLTFRELGEQWTSGELHRRWPDHVKLKKTAHRDAALLEARVYPLVGDVPVVEFTLEHAERVMASLPEMEPATRRQYAQAIARVMTLAAYPARVIERSPLPRGFVPPQRSTKAKSYLYPDEDRRLLGCTAVPLACRVLYGWLAREGTREGEARVMAWSDLDLERGSVRLDENKTDDPRAWAIDAGVVRALRAWRELRGQPGPDERVFADDAIDWDHAAAQLREHLAAAGVSRVELFRRTRSRLAMRVHDLRGTFVTLSLANGKTETWVADRTGHKSSTMINAYRRAARTAAELGLGELAPLDEAIPELGQTRKRGSTDLPQGDKLALREKGPESVPAEVEGSSRATYTSEIVGKAGLAEQVDAGDLKGPAAARDAAHPHELQGFSMPDATDRAGGTATVPFPADAGPFQTPSGPIHGDASRSPRGQLIAELSASLVRAVDAGDVAAAKVAHDAIGKLLGAPAGEGADVVDLAARRGGHES